jgi:hypothetical protein
VGVRAGEEGYPRSWLDPPEQPSAKMRIMEIQIPNECLFRGIWGFKLTPVYFQSIYPFLVMLSLIKFDRPKCKYRSHQKQIQTTPQVVWLPGGDSSIIGGWRMYIDVY